MKYHRIVLNYCCNLPDFLSLMDTNIPIHLIEKGVNKMGFTYTRDSLFVKNTNMFLDSQSKTFNHVVESVQAYAFRPLTENNVKIGTIKKMRLEFKDSPFPSMQQNPDVALNFSNSAYAFQEDIGIDFKNIMGKTQYSNRNQVSIGDMEIYLYALKAYKNELIRKHEIHGITNILNELEFQVTQNNWEGQLEIWAKNLHKFPKRWAPPLHMSENFSMTNLTIEMQKKILLSKKRLQWLSDRAFEKNIPEDHFSGSIIQALLSELPQNLENIPF